jgi:hypothetical protein
MEFTAFKRVAIKSLDLPGDIKDRMQKRHVKELADSFDDTGGQPGNTPWVANGTRKLVAGRDRVAAAMLRKMTHLWCRFGDFANEGEIKRAERTENLRRRDINREKLLAEAVKQEEAELKAAEKAAAEEAKAKGGTDVPAKKKATKKAARAKVAAKAGIKPESVRKAEQRQKAKEAPAKPPKPPIDTLGLPITKGLHSAVERIVNMCKDFEGDSKAMLSELSKLASHLPGHVTERLRGAIQELGDIARAVKPTHLCPKCKGEGDEKCPLCKGAHYARAEQMKDVPKEWLTPPPKNGAPVEASA